MGFNIKVPVNISVNVRLVGFLLLVGLLFVLAVVLVGMRQFFYADAFLVVAVAFGAGVLFLPALTKNRSD